MIATLAWKEYREHRAVWLSMAGVTALALASVQQLESADAGHRIGATPVLVLVALVFTWTYGMVCGAMLLAGEREAGTLPLLDMLEGRRARVWTTKVVVGAGLTLAQSLLLAGLGTGLAAPGDPQAVGAAARLLARGGLPGRVPRGQGRPPPA